MKLLGSQGEVQTEAALALERLADSDALVTEIYDAGGITAMADILAQVDAIYWQSAVSHAMPPGNVIWVEPEERAMLAKWRAMLRSEGVPEGDAG